MPRKEYKNIKELTDEIRSFDFIKDVNISLKSFLINLWSICSKRKDYELKYQDIIECIRESIQKGNNESTIEGIPIYKEPSSAEQYQAFLKNIPHKNPYECFEHAICFQIYDLSRIDGPLFDWYNTDLDQYLECATAGLQAKPVSNEIREGWSTLAELLEMGRQYE